MNWIKKLLRPYTFEGKVEKVLAYPLLTFHYQSRATQTDLVHVYRPLTGELVLSYPWIEGEEAGPFHPLRKLHERFKTYTAQQAALTERLRAAGEARLNRPVIPSPQPRRFTAVPVPPSPAPRDLGRRVDSNDLGPDLLMTSMLASMITPAASSEPEKECRAETFRSGEGGDFGGAGASGSWEAPPPPAPAPSPSYSSSSDNYSSSSDNYSSSSSSDSGSSSSGGGGGD